MIRELRKILSRLFHRSTPCAFGSEQWKSQFEYFGNQSKILPPAILSVGRGLSVGDATTILEHSRIQNFHIQGQNPPRIEIGNRCYICYYFTILNASSVSIGDDVLIASHVMISSENHGIDPESDIPYMHQPLISQPVVIGDGCWIGEKVCILPGVSIGKKCIIGAGSVVTKSIPDYSIAVGNPAKVIKRYNFTIHNWENI